MSSTVFFHIYGQAHLSQILRFTSLACARSTSQLLVTHKCRTVFTIHTQITHHILKFSTSSSPPPASNMAEDASVTEVCEGLANVLYPKSVFYNPVQEYNRDLTIAVISEFSEQHQKNVRKKNSSNPTTENDVETEGQPVTENDSIHMEAGKKYDNGITIFEGLAASGLRSVRFGLEIPGVKEVIANDFDENAVAFIKQNIERNGLDHIMSARHGDAAMGMYEHKAVDNQFHVIDLDPYGSPTVFLDSALQAVKDGGLLCVTCTDAAVLCGNALEKCNANYGAVSLRSKFCHEMGLRIILQCLDSHANRYSRYIVPLISLSIDFYFRVFVQVYTGQRQVKHSSAKKAMVFECVGCGSYALQPMAQAIPTRGEGNFKFLPGTGPVVPEKCQHCGHQHRIGGPIWSAPLHDQEFVRRVLNRVENGTQTFHTADRISGMLNVALEELPNVPLYYVLDAVCSVLHCLAPSMKTVRSALLNAGYQVSLSHAAKNSYKTDAPTSFIWDIMRAWVKEHPVSQKRLVDGSIAKVILDQPQTAEVSFEEHAEANPQSREKGLKRWQLNPERNWGPKAKAKRSHNTDLTEKRAANQGKTKRLRNDAECGEETGEEVGSMDQSSGEAAK